MSTEAPAAPAAPAAAQTVKSGGVTFTRETVTPETGGAQAVRPAPAGIIPPPVKSIALTPDRGQGPARKAMLDDLHKRAKPAMTHENEARKAEAAKVADKPKADAEMGDELEAEDAGKAPVAEKVEDAEQPAEGKKEKVNPWKLVEEHKTARAKLEKEIADLKKVTSNSEELKQQMAEIEKIKARNAELEGAIALVDARKDAKFIKDYQKPYEKAWTRAMTELRTVTVEDPDTGESRPIKPDDLIPLVNAPTTAAARRMAEELFGEDSVDVMEQRNTIRGLFEKQQEYLDEVSKNGGKMMEERAKQMEEQTQKLHSELTKIWEAASNELVSTDAMKPYFAPVDGDEIANQKLEKGYQFVDDAMKGNPRDPNLTEEQRAKIVRAHAAIRHRAAAFTRLTHMLAKERAALAETKKRLSQYESTEPDTASGVKTATANSGRRSAWDEVRAALHAKAK